MMLKIPLVVMFLLLSIGKSSSFLRLFSMISNSAHSGKMFLSPALDRGRTSHLESTPTSNQSSDNVSKMVTAISSASSSSVTDQEASSQTSPEIHAIIFDLDGTLLDTESLAIIAIQQVLDRFPGCEPITWELHRRLLGLRGPAWSPIVIEERGLTGKITPVEFVEAMEANLAVLCSQVQKMPGK
jgi:hypothetical protein